MGVRQRLECLIKGHDVCETPEIVDWRGDRESVVVATHCYRCGEEFVGEVAESDLIDRAREGPWKTEPCSFCRRPVLQSQTAEPRVWPNVVICPECRGMWDLL